MSPLFAARIKRIGPERYRIKLPEGERMLLGSLLPQLREVLMTDDVSVQRLFPNAYPEDAEKAAGYAAMTRDDLTERRFAQIDLVLDMLDDTERGREVDIEELHRWMRAVHDLSLVRGTILDVSEDDDIFDVAEDHPDRPAWEMYHYLAALQSWIIDALTKDL